ncbi:hypothetical protein GCM10009740_16110 [Terrabacter terrae]|uniref:Blue (type 1) copper domain-containing protein n=2 Tax=Terrabacter terrae TaxID=318434 RepID=A0ABP5FI45_9MICO
MLSACRGSDADSADSSNVESTPTIEGTQVMADPTEFAIRLDKKAFEPGTFTFVARERGKAPHAVAIEGLGVETASTGILDPGEADAAITVDLVPGIYTLWCPVGSHRSVGMELRITVS